MHNYNELILSAGGAKGTMIIGSLEYLFCIYNKKNFTYYTGTSIGALICFLLTIEYDINELKQIFLTIDYQNFRNININNLMINYGLDDCSKLMNLIKAMLYVKNIDYNISFIKLFNLNNITLTIVASNITNNLPEYFNHINTPNMSIIDAIRMSISIPLYFTPILYNNSLYIDGALFDPYPYNYIKDTNKIGIWVISKDEYDKIFNINTINNINNINFENYFTSIITCLWINSFKNIYNKMNLDNTIMVIDYNNIDFISYNDNSNLKKELYKFGYDECEKYFYKKNRNKYLINKYLKKFIKKKRLPTNL